MSNLAHETGHVQPDISDLTHGDYPFILELMAWGDPPTYPDAPPAPAGDPAAWLAAQAVAHECASLVESSVGTHSMVADALRRLARSFRFYRAGSVAEWQAQCPRFRRVDLGAVRMEGGWGYESRLARELCEAAALYLSLYSDRTRLVAVVGKVLLDLAAEVEGYKADTADAYREAYDKAYAEALDTMYQEWPATGTRMDG